MEGVEVITRARCRRCGAEGEERGANGDKPPHLWARATVTFVGRGAGWSDSIRHEVILCPPCALAVKGELYGPLPADAASSPD